MTLPDPPILVVTDRAQCNESIESRALALFRGGCRWLSLREKDMEPGARLSLLERLTAIGRAFGATIGVHEDLGAALAVGAAVHLPASADPVAARLALGIGGLIGQSCHDTAELEAAARGGADSATLGPVFPTAGKPGYQPALPLKELGRMAAGANLPVLALGGVTIETARAIVRSGFAGVAVMGVAMRTPDPEGWFASLAAAVGGKDQGG